MINVVVQQNSRKVLMMVVLMSETSWAHKKWNKIASDIKLVFYSSTMVKSCYTCYTTMYHWFLELEVPKIYIFKTNYESKFFKQT